MTGRISYHPTDPTQNQFFVDGKLVSKDDFELAFPSRLDFNSAPGGHLPSCWPMVSDACMVHPDQIPEAHAHAVKIGVPTDFTSQGQPIFRDQAHRREYVRAQGMHDNQGGYSDP